MLAYTDKLKFYDEIMPKRTHIVSHLALLYSLCLLSFSTASAQKILRQQPAPQSSSSVRFQHLGNEQGLPQNSVRRILQDHFGYLWFGTEDGLARFDGYGFTVFRHDPQDSASLSNSYITVLLEDRAGTLWVGTNGGGLNRFDRAKGTFTHYKNNPTDSASLSDNNVRSLLEDHAGMMWVGTFANGLNRFDRTKNRFLRYKHDPKNPSSLSNNTVRALVEDRFGTFWVGTDGGLNRFDRATGHFRRFQHDPADSTSLSHNVILSLIEEQPPSSSSISNVLWMGTWEGGLNRFDCATGKFVSYQNKPDDPTSLSNNGVWTLVQDHLGVLWAGTWGGGLNRFDQARGTFTRFQHNPSNPTTSLSNNLVLSLLEDRSGTLWVGTGTGGLNRFNRITEAFTRYQHQFDTPTSLGDNVVRSLATDETGTVWVGTSNGLNALDKTTGTFTLYRHTSDKPKSMSDNIVWSLLADRTGTIWAGTEMGGLNRFDRATKTFISYKNDPTDSTSLSNNSVRALMEDHLGVIWAGTLWGGVNCFDRKTGKFTRFQQKPNDATGLNSNNIRALLEDRFGTVWVGTGTGGLDKFDRSTGRFIHYTHNPNDTTSLSNNIVRCLLEDRAGTLWVGTHGGLNRFDRTKGTFTIVREKDGLPNDVIYGIMDDERGNLWLSTNKGLCRFTPGNRTIATFDKRDGLQDNEFNGGAYARGLGGEMYFGGINGFNEFLPHTIVVDTVPPPVLLTMFRKFNRSATLDSAIEVKKVITLPYSDNSISLEFVAMSFRNVERNLYSYTLEGFDKDWSLPGTERKATYTNLEPGEYVFRVRGSNSDRMWNMIGAQVRIIILPPWWRTWWAYTAYALCGIAAFTMLSILVQRRRIQLLRDRQKQREEEILRLSNIQLTAANDEITRQQELVILQNKHLQELDTEKNEMLGIVAHDLKSPLSGVRNLAALMEEYAETLPKGDIARYAQMIHESSNRMFHIVRSLLDINALEQGGMKPFFVETDCTELLRPLVQEYRERAAEKSLTLEYEEQANMIVCTDESLLMQVAENLLSNAVKYSPPHTTIWLSLERLKTTDEQQTITTQHGAEQGDWVQGLRISVRDEGPGFQDAEKHKLFGKFARLSAQPTGGEDSTGLGLSIVKKMVESMNGKVWCESEAGKGATFIVELPLLAAEERNSSIFIT